MASGCSAAEADDADDADVEVSESELSTHGSLLAEGFAKKGSFTKACPGKYPLPAGCDLWEKSLEVSRYEHADGRVLYLAGDQVWGSYQRGSKLHTVLASGDRTYRHGRHLLVTLVDFEWNKDGEPTAIVDVDAARADLVGDAPSTFGGVPLESRGDLLHASGVRLARRGLAYVSDDRLGMVVSYNGAYQRPRFSALRPQLNGARIGKTYFTQELLHGPDGEVPTVRDVPTPAPDDTWAVVAAPEVVTGTLTLRAMSGTYERKCVPAGTLEVSAPHVVACAAGADEGCSSDGKRFAFHVALGGIESEVAYVREAQSIASTVALDGGRVFEGKDAAGGDVVVTLNPAGAPWQVKAGGRTYGFPDGARYDYATAGCRASRP